MSEIMSKYLLLRDNKQTGPHSFEEMLELGFRQYDLVWVEGKSAAWRYPGEINEFKEFAPLVEEQPFDRFFKKAVSSEKKAVSGEQIVVSSEKEEVSSEQEAVSSEKLVENRPVGKVERIPYTNAEAQVPKQEGVKHEEIEKRREALKETQPKQDDSRFLPKEKTQPVPEVRASQTTERHRSVAITMPATRRNNPIITPQPKKSEPEPVYVPFTSALSTPAPVTKVDDEDDHFTYSIPPKPFSGDYTHYLQYAGVGAALISLLVVGILIGMGIGNDTTPPAPLTVQQPSRIAELKEKLSNTASAEPIPAATQLVTSDEPEEHTPILKEPVKKDPAPLQQDVPVNKAYNTSNAPVPVDVDGKRAAVKRVDADPEKPAPTSPDISKIALSLNEYKVNMFGGIDGIEVTVANGTGLPIDELVVELRYILSNKNKKYLTETVRFRNLKPGETQTLPGPKSNRGIKLESSIVSVN
jgi:hypothetical protein